MHRREISIIRRLALFMMHSKLPAYLSRFFARIFFSRDLSLEGEGESLEIEVFEGYFAEMEVHLDKVECELRLRYLIEQWVLKLDYYGLNVKMFK